jgi:hypothetical protein
VLDRKPQKICRRPYRLKAENSKYLHKGVKTMERTITITLAEYNELVERATKAEEKIAAAKRLIDGTDYPQVCEVMCILGTTDEESEGADDGLF